MSDNPLANAAMWTVIAATFVILGIVALSLRNRSR